MFLKKYKPVDYWTKRGKIYKNEFVHNDFFKIQENMIVNYLETIEFESVLEFGCGFGRITNLILEKFKPKKYKAFDLSEEQINNSKITCEKFNVDFEVSTIQDYSDNQKYDLVIGIEILMHIPPLEIQNVLDILSKFTNQHMINVDFYENPIKTKLANHNFCHEYVDLYKNILNLKEINQKMIHENQSLFHAQF